jgi:UDP-N-acetylglucosamine transferase subunit ALG13
MKLLLIASSGGHLAHLMWLEAWWRGHERAWVTFDTPDARARLRGEDVTFAAHPTNRHPLNLARNVGRAARHVASLRPDLALSTGAGVAVPWLAAAALSGARTAFLEVADRGEAPSWTARLVAPWVDVLLWTDPAGVDALGRGEVIGPPWIEGGPAVPPGDGPWLVLTGTHHQPFDALVAAADALAASGEPVVVQSGASAVVCRHAAARAWWTPDEIEAAARSARGIIGHATPATALLAWRYGRRPVLLPRRARRGEHVDDHQVRWAAGQTERAVVLDDPADLARTAAWRSACAVPTTVRAPGFGPGAIAVLEAALTR